jgi:hypothetical protein
VALGDDGDVVTQHLHCLPGGQANYTPKDDDHNAKGLLEVEVLVNTRG